MDGKKFIEIKKPIEIVHELKDKKEYQIPSYEEFMETYDEPSEDSEFLAEIEYQDRVLNGPKYGPGNEQSKTAAKAGGTLALGVLTVVCPPAGVIVGAGVAGGGVTATVIGLTTDNEEATNTGLEMISIGGGAAIGGTSGLKTHSGKSCLLPHPKK